MQTKGLLLLWGILASCQVFSADGSTIPSLGDIAAKFQESRILDTVNIEEPTEQEWIEIITETLQGNSMPKYLAERNYTFHVNEMGEFSNSDGVKGSWISTSYLYYNVTEEQALRYIFNVRSEEVGDQQYETASELLTMFTFFEQSYVSAHALIGETFVKHDDVLQKTGNFLGFGQGQVEIMDKDLVQFMDNGMMVANTSDAFSVSEVDYRGLITVDVDIYHIDAGLFRNSVPLNSVDVASLPKNPEALASLFRDSRASAPHVAATSGTVLGEQTVGEVGYYKGDIEAVTLVFPERVFNTTANVQATYDNKQTHTHLLIQDLIDINNPFLG